MTAREKLAIEHPGEEFYGGCIDGYREERKGRKEEDKT